MTTPTGQIRFSEIASEFGEPAGKNLGAYRVNQFIGDRYWTLDDGVPISNTIRFSQLRGKTLNVVIDYTGSTEYSVVTSDRYPTATVVGGFRGLPDNNSGTDSKKVRNLIRKQIGGSGSSPSVKTGNWTPNTQLFYYITRGAVVSGKGGDGGRGGEGNKGNFIGPEEGQPGGSGFGASYPCNIIIEFGGRLQGGFGGGGGGGKGYCDPDDNQQDPVATGGGGGGGAGLPGGSGGLGGKINNQTPWYLGADGQPGTLTAGGAGGSGSNSFPQPGPRNCAWSGGGGGGGGVTFGSGGQGGVSGYSDDDGSPANSNGGGSGGRANAQLIFKPGGANGNAIIYNSGITVNVTQDNGAIYLGGSVEGTFS
jgi:hypothetical protein